MDWQSHVILSAKLLESCGLDKGASIYSNLPAIDIKPAHYHRVYAHILENLPVILDAGLEVLGNGHKEKVYSSAQEQYAYTRICEEAEIFTLLKMKASQLLADEDIARISSDKMSAGVSLISHIYLDTFNNPVQVFLPYSSKPSGQWDLWDSIDYMGFRGEFYKEDNIIDFQSRIASSDVWKVKLNPPAIIKAMIIRVGEMSQPTISYEIVDNAVRKFLRYMGIDQYQRTDNEMVFCRNIEDAITRLIKAKFGK